HLAAADERPDSLFELAEVPPRVFVDESNRRAGKNVVELLKQEELPEAIELGVRIGTAAHDSDQLGVMQVLLGQAVCTLDERLRGVPAAVFLEVELADDDRPLVGFTLERAEELLRCALPCSRQSLQVARAADRLEHFARRPAAAVAPAVDEQARR